MKAGWHRHSDSAQNKKWTTAFVARILALLLIICKQERKACRSASDDCKGNIDVKGCFLCKQYVAANELAVRGATDWCLWDCSICKCNCKCTFKQDKRFTIHASIKANAKQQNQKEQVNQAGKSLSVSKDDGEDVFWSRL